MKTGVAFSTIGQKNGRGRSKEQVRARHVEDQPCGLGLTHTLTNDARARTTCVFCGEPWSVLDAALRETP